MTVSLRKGFPRRRDKVWLRQASQENALYNEETHDLYFLNETALAIWDLCDGETRGEEMILAICDASGMHIDVISEDVIRILSQFESAGLIEWAS